MAAGFFVWVWRGAGPLIRLARASHLLPSGGEKGRDRQGVVTEISEAVRGRVVEMVAAECGRAIGFDMLNGGSLVGDRERALLYAKGEMPDLVMQLAGRSKVVSTDVADAIETALPDLIDIFTGGDDVVAFEPVGEADVQAAEQEQDYLRHVLFNRNSGWLTIYEAFKDALTCKTGVFAWRWEGQFAPEAEVHEAVPFDVLLRCRSEGEVRDVRHEDGLFSFTFVPSGLRGRVVVEAVAPEDLAVAADTRTLATATYCAVRQRPRAQDLIAMGYDREVIDALPAWTGGDSPEASARDTADESQVVGVGSQDLRQVEVYRHYVRVFDEDDRRYRLYQVLTGGRGFTNAVLDVAEVSRVQLAAITPFINPHRFYGESIADKLMEVQKIKTSLMRAMLDRIYFSLNQRMEVAEDGLTPDTLSDLLNNEPGMPVRVRRAGTVTPLQAGGLEYDPLAHLEYMETVGEKRTGIVRNAQGLNPDTLHDTKGGMEILANSAQKRLRLIARTFAETGYKDFLVNLHATIRENGASLRDTVRLRDRWVDIDPSTWRQRDDMVIQIGVGAGGREHDLMLGQQLAVVQEKLMAAQAAPDGPLIDKQRLYNSAVYVLGKMGLRAVEKYIGDPSKFVAPVPAGPPPVDAGLAKVQAEAQAREADRQLKAEQLQAEISLKHAQISAEIELKKYEIDANIALQREQIAVRGGDMELDAHRLRVMADGLGSDVRPGGAPG